MTWIIFGSIVGLSILVALDRRDHRAGLSELRERIAVLDGESLAFKAELVSARAASKAELASVRSDLAIVHGQAASFEELADLAGRVRVVEQELEPTVDWPFVASV